MEMEEEEKEQDKEEERGEGKGVGQKEISSTCLFILFIPQTATTAWAGQGVSKKLETLS